MLPLQLDYGNPFEERSRKLFDHFNIRGDLSFGTPRKIINSVVGQGLLFGKNMEPGTLDMLYWAFQHYDFWDNETFELGRIWGEVYMPVALFGGFALHSWPADDTGTRKIACEIGQATIYAGVTNYLLKVAFGRAMPYTEEGPGSFHPFSALFNGDIQSLPSGHTTVAFVLSTVLSRNAKPVWLKAVIFVPAALTFISRVYQDQHWVSDAFLGAAFGYFKATWVVDQHEQGEGRIHMSSLYPLTITIALN